MGAVKSFGGRSPWLLVAFMLVGAVAGSLADSLLVPTVPQLKNIFSVGLRPATLDLHFLSLTFGFSLAMGPLALAGLVLGYIIYRRS